MLIRVLSHGGQPLAAPSSARFDAAGGFIGRGTDCTLVLPDAQRLMSRRHAQLLWRDGRLHIRQLGANLGVELDGQPLGLEGEAPLAPGMTIRIGPYLLETAADAPAAEPPAEAAPPAPRPGVFSEVLAEVAARAGVAAPLPPPQAAPAAPVAAPAPAPAPATAPVPVTQPATPTDAAQALVAALYAGLELPVPASPSPQEARLIGELLHAALGGLLELLAARHVAKRELGAPATRLQPRENNALKFSPDVDTALAHLLGPARRGFIPPLAAVREACEDLRTHEIALLAGMRASVQALLGRLAPEAMEELRQARGGWSPPLDVLRKAQLWDRYCGHYAQLLSELREQADPLSSRAFVEAYEAQREKLAHPPRED
ncbi:type VI secretion system-associated FHA domain protein TagH [Azohydromonas aeria]|uniref:type VI secretion system-associated FHA domain protein TagH n=1 Tax=Azohydromonas aeria TaxID=2590212 RepID=UPI0012FCE277|nr:type VI secretion system-associated FHA domain protein TagH [Azohydromonas aeria]